MAGWSGLLLGPGLQPRLDAAGQTCRPAPPPVLPRQKFVPAPPARTIAALAMRRDRAAPGSIPRRTPVPRSPQAAQHARRTCAAAGQIRAPAQSSRSTRLRKPFSRLACSRGEKRPLGSVTSVVCELPATGSTATIGSSPCMASTAALEPDAQPPPPSGPRPHLQLRSERALIVAHRRFHEFPRKSLFGNQGIIG